MTRYLCFITCSSRVFITKSRFHKQFFYPGMWAQLSKFRLSTKVHKSFPNIFSTFLLFSMSKITVILFAYIVCNNCIMLFLIYDKLLKLEIVFLLVWLAKLKIFLVPILAASKTYVINFYS